MEKISLAKTFSQGIRDALPTALGYISIGIAFGVVAAESGFSALQVGLMSLMVYGGSAQFAFVAMFVAGESLFSIVLTVFFVNLRNMLMSLHATTIFNKSSLLENIAIGTLITDESYGVLLGEQLHNQTITTAWMHGNNLLGYLVWFFSTVVGSLLGSIIPNPESLGLDYALVAMFLGIFAGQFQAMMQILPLKKLGKILGAVTLSYLVLSLFLSSSLAVLAATLLGCGMGVYLDGH